MIPPMGGGTKSAYSCPPSSRFRYEGMQWQLEITSVWQRSAVWPVS